MGTKEKKDKIKEGIEKYLKIKDLYPKTNFNVNSDFAKAFGAFYLVRRNEAWREEFFKLFDEIRSKSVTPDFKTILETLHLRLKKLNEKAPQTVLSTIEASFVSKMLHTVNPDMPIWDSIVLSKLGYAKEVQPYKMNSLSEQARLDKCEEVYNKLIDWYKGEDAEKYKEQFDMDYPEYKDKIGRTKKIDFMLWGTEDEPERSAVDELLRKHFKDFGKKDRYNGLYADDPKTLDHTEYLLGLQDEDVKTEIWNVMTYKLEREFPELKPIVNPSKRYPLLKAFIKEREKAFYHYVPVNQPIETERLLLKPMPDNDAEYVFEAIKRDHETVPSFWNCLPDDPAIDDYCSFPFLNRRRLARVPGFFGIYLARVKTPIGYVGLMEYAKSKEGKSIFNIEYYVLPAYRHNGYTKEACLALLDALANKRINGAKETERDDVYTPEPYVPSLVLGTCRIGNEASKHILESLGFVYDGLFYEKRFCYDGEPLREHHFHLLFDKT